MFTFCVQFVSMRYLLILIGFFTFQWVSAQQGNEKARIINNNDYDGSELPKLVKKSKVPANIIKISLMSPLRGDYVILYERKIKPWVSVQVGAGGTYRDRFFERFTSSTFANTIFKPTGGYSVRAGLRFYPIADGWMSGTFFSPDFVHRAYFMRASLVQYDAELKPFPQELTCGYSINEYRFLIGQSYDHIFKSFYTEYYFGLVFRDIRESTPQFQSDAQGAYYTRAYSNKFIPGMAFNLAVGYSF